MTDICFRCGYPKGMHEKGRGRVVIDGVRKCHKYMRFRRRWAFVRLLTCPLHIHRPRIMVLVQKGEKADLFQCPRCKHQARMDAVTGLVSEARR